MQWTQERDRLTMCHLLGSCKQLALQLLLLLSNNACYAFLVVSGSLGFETSKLLCTMHVLCCST